jgi:plastocyanin
MQKSKVLVTGLFIAMLALGAIAMTGPSVSAQADPVSCSPSSVSVAVGQAVTLSASGGDDEFIWSSPGLTIANPSGENFTVTFNVPGDYTVSVESDGETDTCAIAVSATEAPAPGIPAPGLPNTGELPV